jgi:maleate isomerase
MGRVLLHPDPEPVDRPVDQRGVGVVVPYDFALDRELWRWTPPEVSLHLTRTPFEPLEVGVAQALAIGDRDVVSRCTRDLTAVGPEVVAYACTSGSFAAGRDGEQALTGAMRDAGAPAAVTTSGALSAAVAALGVGALALATPYDDQVAALLRSYLGESGVEVTRNENLGLHHRIWTVPGAQTADLVRRTAAPGSDAVFVSCTNLPTYDLVVALEAELGIPVITANQVTMWAALGTLGLAPVGPGQRLLDVGYPPGGRS